MPQTATATRPRPEVTPLAPADESAFRAWAQQNSITDVDDPRSFYDYRGYWKDVASKGGDQRKRYDDGLHFPDTYKQHGHPTFSVESKYSRGPGDGGTWNGETYVPASSADPVADYLRTVRTTDDVRAQAWDALNDATSDADLTARLQRVPVGNAVRAALFDLYPQTRRMTMPEMPMATSHAPPKPFDPNDLSLTPNWLDEVVEGGVRELVKRGVQGGDWIRRGWNAVAPESMQVLRPALNPAVQEMTKAPDTTAGRLGALVEQGLELAAPLGAVSRLVKGASLPTRALAEGTAAAAATGVQTGGDTDAMMAGGVLGAALPVVGAVARPVIGAVKSAAAGAAEGGVGGAIAGATRTVLPQSSRAMLMQAIKPRASRVNFEASLDLGLPEIKAAAQKPIETIDDLLTATKDAKRGVWAQYEALAGPARARGQQVDLTGVADAMVESIPSKVRLESPQKAQALIESANVYRQRFSLADAEQLLLETNADLDSFYAMYPGAQRRALMARPEAAQLEAQGRALRDAIYRTLDAAGEGGAAKELKRRYGALMEIEGEAFRRANVAKRQQPESLSEQIGQVRAAMEIARGLWKMRNFDLSGGADIAAGFAGRSTAKFLRDQQTTDALIRRAFQNFTGKPVPVAMPAQPQIRGLLEPGPIVTPAPADRSFVRGVPAEYARREPRALLPEGRPAIPLGAGPDPSFVRSVPETDPLKMYPASAQSRPASLTLGTERSGVSAYAEQPPGGYPPSPQPGPVRPVAPTSDEVRAAFARAEETAAPDDLAHAFHADALHRGYAGSVDEFRSAFSQRTKDAQDFIDDLVAEASEHNDPTALLRDIAKLGGIGRDKGRPGELAHLWETSDTIRRKAHTRGQKSFVAASKTVTGGLRGVSGVLKKDGGHTLDYMAEQLRDYDKARYAHISGPDELIHAIESALGRKTTAPAYSLRDALEALGVKPGARWWEEADDLGFDPSSFD